MPNLPDIGKMAPDEFLSQLQKMRDELVGEMAAILGDDAGQGADEAAEALAALFKEYALGDAESDPQPLIDVKAEGADRLIFRREDADRQVVLVREDGRWVEEDAEEPREPEELALEILKLVPWWSEGAFVDSVGRR